MKRAAQNLIISNETKLSVSTSALLVAKPKPLQAGVARGHRYVLLASCAIASLAAGLTSIPVNDARVAAEAGEGSSQVDLANLVLAGAGEREDPVRIAAWFEQAAASGDLVAAFNLGLCLTKGVGVERNEKHAAILLRRAAEGVAEAQYMYGRMLAEGRGVSPDLAGARAWFARAAEAGVADAQVALAEMMVNGRGGPRDATTARELFEKAAAKEHSGAMFALGALHGGGHGLPMDRQTAQRWFRAAAELGHGHAQLMLARYLASGVAGERNPVEARLWLERATAQGIPEAETDLAEINSSTPLRKTS